VKKLNVLSVLLSLAALILPPASSIGKYDLSKPTVIADGQPIPSFSPNPPKPTLMSSTGLLVADGYPYPPIPPKPPNASVMNIVA